MNATAILAEPIAAIGHNGPPADPFDGFSIHVQDLLTEARNFLDASGVQNEGQAEAVSALLEQLRRAAKDADTARAAEKKPHDDAAKLVQAKWKPLLDKCDLAAKTCKDALSPYLQRLEAGKRAAAEAARREAEELARAAAEAMRAAKSSPDLSAREAAEVQVQQAQAAEKVAHKAEGEKAHAKGGARATTLRSTFTPVLTDPNAALAHYVARDPEAIKACLLQLGKADVQRGLRTIPGFDVQETRVVV